MNTFKIPAHLTVGDTKIKGYLSAKDGTFSFANTRDIIFTYKANIEFVFDNITHSFGAVNLGGKYFVKNYNEDLDYQKFLLSITLNNVLEKHDKKAPSSKPKL